MAPSDKIRILELKFALFDSISLLKSHYFEQHILKQLCSLRLQIAEMLRDNRENLDKYHIATGLQEQAKSFEVVTEEERTM